MALNMHSTAMLKNVINHICLSFYIHISEIGVCCESGAAASRRRPEIRGATQHAADCHQEPTECTESCAELHRNTQCRCKITAQFLCNLM